MCNSNIQIHSPMIQMKTFAPHLIKSAPPLLIHANMDFNNFNELHIDSNVHLSTSNTQISTFRELTSTCTIVEHLQGPNSSMCTAAAPPNSLCLAKWPPMLQTRCCALQCFKSTLVHLQSSKSTLVHLLSSKSAHELLQHTRDTSDLLHTTLQLKLLTSNSHEWAHNLLK
jgi:hypothetical protein